MAKGPAHRWIRDNALGLVAIFIALGGTAIALPGKNTVTADDLIAESVRSKEIRNEGITDRDLADGAVTTPKLADFAVTNPKLADEAVSGEVLARDAVSSPKVLDDSLTGADIDEATLRQDDPCAEGQVRGFALVDPAANGTNAFPTVIPTSNPIFIRQTYNCAGGPVLMRNRPENCCSPPSPPYYSTAVTFTGNPARTATVTMAHPGSAGLGITPAAQKQPPDDRDPSAFVVDQFAGGGRVSYHPFFIVVY